MRALDWLTFFAMRAIPLTLACLLFSFLLGQRNGDVFFLAALYFSFTLSPFLSRCLYGNVTVLCVSNDEIVATGNIGKVFTKRLTVPTSEVESLRESSGGLYLERDSFWKESGWILPGLNREQGRSLIGAILMRFPDVWEVYDVQKRVPFGFRTGLRLLRPRPSDEESGMLTPNSPSGDGHSQM
jgi:hypothetical protein